MLPESRLKPAIPFLLVLLALSSCIPTNVLPRGFVAPAASPPSQLVHAAVAIQIPSHLSERGQALRTIFATASLNQDMYRRYDTIIIQWPDDLDILGELTIRIQSPSGRIYAERLFTARASATARLGLAYVFPEGDYHVVLMPTLGEYYVDGLRIERTIPIRIQSTAL